MTRISAALLLVIPLLAAACDNSPTGPSPFTQTINGSLASFAYTSHELTASRAGTMTVTLTWTAASDRDLDLYLTNGGCLDIYDILQSCTTLAESIASAGNMEAVTQAVQQGTSYRIWVDSFSGSNHSYSLQITIE